VILYKYNKKRRFSKMELIKKDSYGIEIEYIEMGKLEWFLQEAKIPYRIEYIWGCPLCGITATEMN
jgi:hypothetical protein